MSWMEKLCEAYDAGIICDQSKEAKPLVPLGFVRKKIKYHIVLSRSGSFVSADELMDEKQLQEIPSTPQAESRTGDNGAPFPLAEQLKYLIYEEENLKRFDRYMEQLDAWCKQPEAPACLQAVYTYLDGHTLLADLESQPNLKLKYYKNAEKREGTGEDAKAMLCFSVQMQDGSSDDLWLRQDIKQSWGKYLADKLPGAKDFCYVEGKRLPVMENHPKLQGNAKLISAKDAEFPLQYRGRFIEERSTATVSIDASVRAHNALTWLIARQGMQRFGMSWVVWNINGAEMKVPIDDENGFLEEEEEEDSDSKPAIDTSTGYAKAVRKASLGYGAKLSEYNTERANCAVIMGLQAATDGRMSITYYQECMGNEYVDRLEQWYQDCCWWYYNKKKKVKEIGTPDPYQIAVAVMGVDAVSVARRDLKCEKSHTKFMRDLQYRLLTCIMNKQPLPLDIVRSAFYRACTPLSFVNENDSKWSRVAWENSMDTACALIRYFQIRRQGEGGEVFEPELRMDAQNRDYLYGRLLALADYVERQAVDKGQDYLTNAVRYMRQYAQNPFDTWPKIHAKLIPSFRKLGIKSEIYLKLFAEIEGLFSEEDRCEKRELSLEFLQGFSSQRRKLFQKWDLFLENKANDTIIYELPTRRSGLYGCLLAVADAVEHEASNGDRAGATNALQIMPVFATRPYENWTRLHDKLLPYLERLGEAAERYQKLFALIETQFSQEERESTAPLDGSYLHGYYCMRRKFYRKMDLFGKPQSWNDAEDMRSAIYGRLLGTAERVEIRSLISKSRAEGEQRRSTNELRHMANFAHTPATAWEFLRVKLRAYMQTAGKYVEREEAILEQLEAELQKNGWNSDVPLGSIYLHCYYEERNKKEKEK